MARQRLQVRAGNGVGPEDGINELRIAVDRLGRLLSSRRVFTNHIEAAGTDVSQQGAMLLVTLDRHDGPLTLTTLARHSRIDLSAASRQLRELDRRGFTERAADPADARVAYVRLTPMGRRVARRLVDLRRSHLRRAVEAWPPAKRKRLATMLNEFVDALVTTDVPSRDG
jgi:DNA-binding MarR family transcriptional regulator